MSAYQQRKLFNTAPMASTRQMRQLRRDRQVEQKRIQRRVKLDLNPEDTLYSLNFSDEQRYYLVQALRCSKCHARGQAEMHVRQDGKKLGKKIYFIRCAARDCHFKTPEFGSSQEAVRYWKVMWSLLK